MLVGTSRKSFLGRIGGGSLAPAERLEGTVATSTWAITQGAAMVRVHDVKPVAMAARLAGERQTAGPVPSLASKESSQKFEVGRSVTAGEGAA